VRRTLAALLVLLSSPVWAAKSPDAEGTPNLELKEVTVVENLGATLPRDLTFTNHLGKKVTLGELLPGDKPVLLTPVYYACPTLCSKILKGVVGSLRQTGLKLGQDYTVISYSIDPTETAAMANDKRVELIHELGYPTGAAGWDFLVGDDANTKTLSEAIGFRYKYDADAKQYAHNAVVLALTPEGKVSRYLFGMRFPPKDMKLALVEASEGRTGTPFDRFLLTCFRFDPASRRYELYVYGFLRGGGALVFLALAGWLFRYWRREMKYGHGAKPAPAPAK
jgi:protein SCO1